MRPLPLLARGFGFALALLSMSAAGKHFVTYLYQIDLPSYTARAAVDSVEPEILVQATFPDSNPFSRMLPLHRSTKHRLEPDE